MKLADAVEDIGTSHELKRIASAYVIDYRNLSDDQTRAAIKKTAPQYYFLENVQKAMSGLLFHEQRHFRILSRLILCEVLLQQDHFMLAMSKTEDQVIELEQRVIDRANEDLNAGSGDRSQTLQLFRFILEVAWEYNDAISQDEKNLIEKIKTRLKVTEREYQVIEAKLGKYPKPGNILHTRGEIEGVRRALQHAGLVFAVRDDDGTDYDVIPIEIAASLRKTLGIEMRRHGYRELLDYKLVRSKKYYRTILGKCGIAFDKGATMEQLQDCFLEQVRPSVLLGGVSPNDGLAISDLREWCSDLGLPVSGRKAEVIDRIIAHYDALLRQPPCGDDERAIWFKYYTHFASRDLDFLRNQELIQKDLECEARFEAATSFLFEKRLGHAPLNMVGSSRPDGALSYQDKVILWDNKSKETPVSLKDHIKQFDAYIKASEKPVACFLVIGPGFTPQSSLQAMQYQVETGATVTLISAEDLKAIADEWSGQKATGKDDPFPLGYLIQPGAFNKDLVAAL